MNNSSYFQYVDMPTIYTRTKFPMLSSNCSFVISIKPKAEYKFHAAAMMFYIL
jgi:hypothetical protein